MDRGELISRRTFMKGAAALAAAIPAGAFLAACSSQQAQEPEEELEGPEEQSPQTDGVQAETEQTQQDAAEAAGAGGVLVAYFSATGNTRGVAEAIAGHLGADTFEITPVEPYTADDLGYNNSNSRTSVERQDPDRHVELETITPDGFEGYSTVFVGYPIWWGDASWVVDDFVAGNDFTGKTVVPFCTSGSSPLGSSGQKLAAMAGAGEWLAGARFSGGASESEVAAWVDGLGL